MLPPYYLTHETPAGRRYAYPRPGRDADYGLMFPIAASTPVEWSTVSGSVVQRGDWLISTKPMEQVTVTWQPPDEPGPWVKRTEAPDDPIARQAWVHAPEAPSISDVEHFRSYGCDDDECCLRCQFLRVMYRRVPVAPPAKSRQFDFSLWRPLPGDVDMYPAQQWVVDEPSLLAVFGKHTAHMWPGAVPGFREAVKKALEGHPRVEHVFEDRARLRPGTYEVVSRIPWEKPRTVLRDRYGRAGRKLRGREQVPSPIAHTSRVTLNVAEGLHASSKARAVGSWDAEIERVVGRFLPADVVACDRCDGHGHLLREEVPE